MKPAWTQRELKVEPVLFGVTLESGIIHLFISQHEQIVKSWDEQQSSVSDYRLQFSGTKVRFKVLGHSLVLEDERSLV